MGSQIVRSEHFLKLRADYRWGERLCQAACIPHAKVFNVGGLGIFKEQLVSAFEYFLILNDKRGKFD